MPELRCTWPLLGLAKPGVSAAAPVGGPGVTIGDRWWPALCQLMARRGQAVALARTLAIGDTPGVATRTADWAALPLAPGQWLLIGERGRDGAFARAIAARTAGLGYVSDQSHGRAVIRIGGPATAAVLAKGCRLDLDTRTAAAGFCARTPIAGIDVLLHVVDAAPTIDLIVSTGFAVDFWQWLTDAAGEAGYRVADLIGTAYPR